MRIIVVFLSLIVLLFPLTAISKTYEEAYFRALKSKTPNELAYWVGVDDDCPLDVASVESIVEGVFIRSRIKPLKATMASNPLDVSVSCMDREELSPIYTIKVRFFKSENWPAAFFNNDYGYFGSGRRDTILQGVQRGVEKAVTDHIKANFDL